jgi:PAS domain S-box-containing protein
MKAPDIPSGDPERVAALCALEMLDTPAEERFDRITRIAQRHFKVPIVLVSLVDAGRQWFKSRQGLDATETPRHISFCGHAILAEDIFYIPDALSDPRFADNPLVTGAPHVRFYAGAPLHAPGGERVGTLCVIDRRPRQLSVEDFAMLRDLANGVEAELERIQLLQIQIQMRSAENRLRAVIDTVIDGIVTIDRGGIVQTFNPAAEHIFGYAAAEVIGHNVKLLMPEPYRSGHDGYLDNYLRTGARKVIGIGREVIGRRKDGGTFPMELAVSEMEVGGERMFTGIVRDATKRKAMELASKRYEAIVQSSDDAIMSKTLDGFITSWNLGAEKLFGYRAEEVIGRPMLILFPPELQTEELEILKKIARGETVEHFETVRRRKDGSQVEISASISPIVDEAGAVIGASKIARDISARKQAAAALEHLRRHHERILDAVGEGVHGIDLDGKIVFENPAAVAMLGWDLRELIGQSAHALMHHTRADGSPYPQAECQIYATLQDGITRQVANEVFWRKDGSSFPVDYASTPMRDQQGALVGAVVTFRDVTERKKIERMKSEFVSTVSHELRTPLTSIRGALSLLQGKHGAALPEKGQHLLDMAKRNSERLTLLINDILDLEKIESGSLALEFKALDLAQLAQQALDANEGYAHQHGVRLVLARLPQGAMVQGDEHRLLQVFANLLSNAVKYSPNEGEVVVSVARRDTRYRVSVKDHGRGIPAEFRSRMFQRFAQADSSDTREKGGTGLGLSVTKAIVERHGGTLDFASELGAGSEFFFDLPAWNEIVAAEPGPDARPLLLICEDNSDVAHVLGELLARDGLTTDIAATAAGAKSLLAQRHYQAMVLDLGLPDQDGLALIRELRAAESTRDLPIVVVSGRASEGKAAWEGEALAVADWLQKPVDEAQLAQAVRQALAGRMRPRILHVEDDLDVVQVTRALVEETAQYSYATTLAEARRLLAGERFDLVLLDLVLPDGSGLELLKEFKPKIPVIIFSGQEAGGALGAKVAAALVKSKTSNEQLLATIMQTIQGKRSASRE